MDKGKVKNGNGKGDGMVPQSKLTLRPTVLQK